MSMAPDELDVLTSKITRSVLEQLAQANPEPRFTRTTEAASQFTRGPWRDEAFLITRPEVPPTTTARVLSSSRVSGELAILRWTIAAILAIVTASFLFYAYSTAFGGLGLPLALASLGGTATIALAILSATFVFCRTWLKTASLRWARP